MTTRWPKQMTTAEFCERIRLQVLGRNYVRPPNPLLKRKPTDKGFYPPKRKQKGK